MAFGFHSIAKFVSNAPKNVARGVTRAFSSPQQALLTVSTGGLEPLVAQNKEAVAGGAAAGAAAFLASGGNPVAGLVGAGVGAINTGSSNKKLGTSVYQSAVLGGTIGAGSFLYNLYSAYQYGAALGHAAAAGGNVASVPAPSLLSNAASVLSGTYNAGKYAVGKAADALGLYALLGRGAPTPGAPGGSADPTIVYQVPDPTITDRTVLAGADPGTIPQAAAQPILAAVPWPLVLAVAPLPIYGLWRLYKVWKRRR